MLLAEDEKRNHGTKQCKEKKPGSNFKISKKILKMEKNV